MISVGTNVRVKNDYDGPEAGMVGTVISIEGKSFTVKFHDGGQDFFYEKFLETL